MDEQKLTIIHEMERQAEVLRDAAGTLGVLKESMQRGIGARPVAVALTNLEAAILWLDHAIDVARG